MIDRELIEKAGPGSVDAIISLGFAYYDREDGEENRGKAFELYTKALELDPNNARAINNLGNCYNNGVGVEENTDKAMELYRKAAELGYSNRVFYAFGQGAANLGRWRLPRENFVKIAIPCPPVELQRKIVDEIAAKVSKVDALIANQQAQIEKLKQYKQSLITEVVTKGLNPDAPMKDSKVESIGRIPAHWILKRAKFVATSLVKGNGITKEEVFDDGDIHCARYGEIYSKYDCAFVSAFSKTKKRDNVISAIHFIWRYTVRRHRRIG